MNTNLSQQRPPGYELFFAPLQVALDPSECERIGFAYIASKFGHRNQMRDDGSRYFDHPKSAAWIYISELNGRDERVIIDLLLHDLSEDSYLLSPYRISLNFGEDIALDVRALTKLPKGKETTEEYLERVIAQGPWAIITKLCDRLHNNRSMRGCTAEKREKQIKETREHHLRVLVPALRQYDGQWIIHAIALESMILDTLALYDEKWSLPQS